MGDHGGGELPGGLMPNGLLPNVAAMVARAIDVDRWSKAEARTAELIARIQPNRPSEERRNAVANYVQRLIMKCFSCEVFTFGSVPLKTYLPDGDIDLTAVSGNEILKDTWAGEVCDVLKSEEKNENAEFRVKEVQYIQAEVKIIKCLVEDIVVDISFNQVGGLCTLCFLDEIDTLINQNHLFKRSIILIKAWCYYESRILGAHHGLISTYALETLVLYIFHVYNNSFAGPLEVLYRFLEFFSNFDWENFCVSLWGPVPIHSLPDMIVEPPRQDGGELLLDKAFLDICSTVYAVLPAGQENQVQPFVPKHFNVIDPLRISNNLGRSVSRGNFFRIRSAFAFGAKKLAGLLECPTENLISEVNQFFTNTWDRHSNGDRPDAPSADLWHLQAMKDFPVEESNNTKSTSIFKKKSENNVLLAGHEYATDNGLAYHGATSQVLKTVNQHFQSLYRSNIPSTLYHAQNQKSCGSQIDSEVSDHAERNISVRGSTRAHINQNNFWSDHSDSQAGQDRHQFGRTQSSPELSDSCHEVLARGSRNKVQEIGKNQIVPIRIDHAHGGFGDPSPSRHHVSHRIPEAAGFNSASNSYQDALEDPASVAETLEMHQEEQDLVNMMASSRVHNGQVQLPIHFPLPHVPFPVSPTLIASMASNQRNMTGIVPPNIALIDPSWGSAMQYPQGFISSSVAHYSPFTGMNFNIDDVTGIVNGRPCMTGVNQTDGDQSFWHEDDTNRSEPNGDFQMLHPDDKKHQEHRNVSSSRASNSAAAPLRGHHKVARESKGSADEDDTGAFQYQTSRGNDTHYTVEDRNQGSFPVSKSISLRSKPASESSSVGSDKATKLARDKRGRRLAASAILTALYGNSRNGRQLEGSSDHSSVRDEVSPHIRKHQVPGSEPAEISSSVSMIPIAPVITNSSQQRVVENSGVVPFAFYPTGPPVPFLAMLPMINFPSDTSVSDGSASQFDSDERNDHDGTNPSGRSFDSAMSLVHSEVHASSNPLRNSTPEFEDHKSDILNSDFVSHWQNLQYSRSCQNTRHHGPFMYPSPVMVPPVYLQGHFPWDGPGRPSVSTNNFTQFMGYGPRLVPVAPLQPGPLRNSVFPRYGDEAPRYRGGTGTYLPNPKVPFRERSSSNTRNHRGNYNHDRSDPDREGSWNNPKSRAAGRTNGRIQADRPSSRPNRSSTNDNRADTSWNSHRHEPVDSYQAPTSSFGSRRSSHGSANMTYGVYSRPAVNTSGISSPRPAVPSAVKMYSYDQTVMYGSRAESLKFGSVGAVLSGGDEVIEPDDANTAREGYQQRHGTDRGSSRSSPG